MASLLRRSFMSGASPSTGRPSRSFSQTVTRPRIQVQPVELFQVLDPSQTLAVKRALSVERMQDNALQEIAKRQVVVFGQRLQHFQQPLLHSHAGLHAFHNKLLLAS